MVTGAKHNALIGRLRLYEVITNITSICQKIFRFNYIFLIVFE
jgi:hypothetical protein